MRFLKSFELDFSPADHHLTIALKQFDRQSRRLVITPTYEGNKIDVREYTAKIFAERPDHTVIIHACTISEEGNIIADIADEMILIDGTVRCDVKLYENGAVVSSTVFYIAVKKSVTANNIISVYQKCLLKKTIKIETGNSYYQLSSGEKLIFAMKKKNCSQLLIQKIITSDSLDSEKNGYFLTLTSEETDLEPGQYLYDVTLCYADGQREKIIRPTSFYVLEGV